MGQSTYRAGNAWFICDRCSQRRRRSVMCAEWDGLRVCPPCLDPRPPQMEPPSVYPEGIPFPDARPPVDGPDRLTDATMLVPTGGGVVAPVGVTYVPPNGQDLGPGALSPLPIEATPAITGPTVLEDDVTFITGPVFP